MKRLKLEGYVEIPLDDTLSSTFHQLLGPIDLGSFFHRWIGVVALLILPRHRNKRGESEIRSIAYSSQFYGAYLRFLDNKLYIDNW